MKGIVITAKDKVEIRDFQEPLYKTVGAVVGGGIEIVRPVGLKQPFVMIVNDEGLLMDLELNAIGSLLYGTLAHGSPIVGDIVVMKMGFTEEGPDIVGLEDQEAAGLYLMFTKMLAHPSERSN